VVPFDPASEGWLKVEEEGFTAVIGPVWYRTTDGGRRYALATLPLHTNKRGIVHGGVIGTFADFALAMESRRATDGASQATIQLDLHFVSSVQIGEFIEADCDVTQATRAVTFASGRFRVGPRIVATAQGVWKIRGRS
jgi:uncharacterized protein (TIGR00369 family)